MINKQAISALKTIGVVLCLTFVVVGCGGTTVTRVAADKEMALTDKWNDEDSRLVANAMIDDMLSFPWLKRFEKNFPGKRPTIVVQRITNKSNEHIATDTFINDIKHAVMRNGEADFIVSGAERERLRKELKQQDLNASESTRMQQGEETGANFALSGEINSFVDQLNGKRVTTYQVDLKLINLQTTREAWTGTKSIKKFQERSSFGL